MQEREPSQRTLHGLHRDLWDPLPLPVAEIGLQVGPHDDVEWYERLFDAATRLAAAVGLARCRRALTPVEWGERCREILPALVHPSAGKRLWILHQLERMCRDIGIPNGSGWDLADRHPVLSDAVVSLGRSLGPAEVKRGPRTSTCLDALVECRNEIAHLKLPPDGRMRVSPAVSTILARLLERSYILARHKLVYVTGVTRDSRGEDLYTGWLLRGALQQPLNQGAPQLCPPQSKVRPGRIYLSDGDDLLDLHPLVVGEIAEGRLLRVYLLDDVDSEPRLSSPRWSLPASSPPSDSFDEALPGWRELAPAAADQRAQPPAAAATALPEQTPTLSPDIAKTLSENMSSVHVSRAAESTLQPQEQAAVRPSRRSGGWPPNVNVRSSAIAGAVVLLLLGAGIVSFYSTDSDSTGDWGSSSTWVAMEVGGRSLLVGAYEVTRAEWLDCVREGECQERNVVPEGLTGQGTTAFCTNVDSNRYAQPMMPINCITPSEAVRLCSFLGRRHNGRAGRVPTLPEWVSATRWRPAAPIPCAANLCGAELRSCAGSTGEPHACADPAPGPATVGSFSSDEVGGLRDVTGNVAEIVSLGNGDYGAAGLSFRSGRALSSAALSRLSLIDAERREDAGAQYGVRCVIDAN